MNQCSCGHNHIQVNVGKSTEPMALRLDPTRTTTLRKKMLADVTRRFKSLVQEINKMVVDDDCFGLKETSHSLMFNSNPCHNPAGSSKGGQFCETKGGSLISPILKKTVDIEAILDAFPKVDSDARWFSSYQDQGPEINVREIWPKSIGTPLKQFGISKPRGTWEREIQVDPTVLIPSQPSVIVSAVKKYIDTPSVEKPLLIKVMDKYHISEGHHRLAAAVIKGEKSVTVDAIYMEMRNGKLVQIKPPKLAANAENQFKFTRSSDKVKGFMDWLDQMQTQKILTITTKPGRIGSAVDQAWTDVYIDSAYQQGIRRAGQEMKKGGMDIPIPAGMPGRDPVALAFSMPTHADRVGLIYTRVFNELKGITSAMDQQISSVLAQGLAEGKNPKQIASSINGRVDKIGLTRAKTLARTEIIRAHHMASIQEYRNAGLVGVSVKSEWLTTGFNVCPVCAALEGKIFTLDEIDRMIPRHPNCRCCAIPYIEVVSPKPKQGNFIDSAEEIKNGQSKLEDTSQMPLSMTGIALAIIITNPKYRAWIEETVEEEKQTQEVMPEIDKLFEYATDPKYALKQEQRVYFGLNGEKFKNMSPGDEVYSFGTRPTSFTLKGAETYSRGGGVFEITLPTGTQAVYSEGFNIKELMLLPGSKFEVVSTSNGIHNLKLIDDGAEKVKEVYDWQKKLDKLAEK